MTIANIAVAAYTAAATAPLTPGSWSRGWPNHCHSVDPSAPNKPDLDRPASYSNYGQSAISLGAPGGDFALPGNAVCSKPRLPTGSVVSACWVFDMVMAPCRGGA